MAFKPSSEVKEISIKKSADLCDRVCLQIEKMIEAAAQAGELRVTYLGACPQKVVDDLESFGYKVTKTQASIPEAVISWE